MHSFPSLSSFFLPKTMPPLALPPLFGYPIPTARGRLSISISLKTPPAHACIRATAKP
jgi:hypothetical protein